MDGMSIVVLDAGSLCRKTGHKEFRPDSPLFDSLRDFGKVTLHQWTSPEELLEHAVGHQVILTRHVALDVTTITFLRTEGQLGFIGVLDNHTDIVDVKVAKELGIAVSYAPGFDAQAKAEYVFATLFGLLRPVVSDDYPDLLFEWEMYGQPSMPTGHYEQIGEKRWCIVGTGPVGQRVYRIAEALGADIVQCKAENAPEAFSHPEPVQSTDIFVLADPPPPNSPPLFTEELFRRMKEGTIVVNVADGGYVDINAFSQLVSVPQYLPLRSVLDVFPQGYQPPLDYDAGSLLHRLAEPGRRIVTPGISWYTRGSVALLMKMTAAELKRWIDGR